MPNYSYTAKSLDGETLNGTLFAQSTNQLAQTLKSQGMMLITASEAEGKKKKDLLEFIPRLGVSSVEQLIMTRNLWIMFSSGLPLVRIFEILANQAKNPRLK